ncbi:MAG: undecaprenyl-phosphate glucose phosphotransferase [Gammaproteobacteria bacterium]
MLEKVRTKGLLKDHATVLVAFVRVVDGLLVLVPGLLAYDWYLGTWPLPTDYRIAFFAALLLMLVVFPAFGLYQSGRGGGLLFELRRFTGAWGTVIGALVILGFSTKTSDQFSRIWLGTWGVSTWVALMAFHASLRIGLRWVRERGFNVRRIAIIGAGNLGSTVAKRIQDAPWTGLKILGFYDDNPALHGTRVQGLMVKGPPSRLCKLLRHNIVDEVWLALPLRAEPRVKEILHDLRHSTVTVRFVPDIFGFHLLNHSMSDVAGIPVLDLNASPMVGVNRIIKACEDRLISALVLVMASPVFALLAIGVKLSSPGPVFYRQQRVSWNGRPFMMLKFRSMPVDAERESGAVWAKSGEQRATAFGAFLRRTSLDELAQFLNVLKGDMSIVGPRPERPVFVERFKDEIPNYMKKHLVKAGITGWAQVNGWRGDTDLGRRIECDMQYIENWSLWLDFKIMFLTLFRGFVHKNAY